MINLEKYAGLPIDLDGESIVARDGYDLPEPKFRKIEDMASVLMPSSEVTGPETVYTMYRFANDPKDADFFKEKDQEYDITVLAAGPVGNEFVKTVGHYHSEKEGVGIGYPEVYEVIHGKAHSQIQKMKKGSDVDVEDARIIEAIAGDKIVIPPGYGHITINPGEEILVLSNQQKYDLPRTSDYKSYENQKGAVYYETNDGKLIKNEKYESAPESKILKARELPDVFGVQNDAPLYTDFKNNPEKYDFILNPENYLDQFSQIYN